MDVRTGKVLATGAQAAPTTEKPPARARGAAPSLWLTGRDRWLPDVAVVAVPALLAAALCLFDITSRSLGFDESATAAIAGQHGAALRHAIAHDGGNMSGYYFGLHFLVNLFGRGLVVLRLPSAIAVAFAVAVTGWLGLRLFDRRAALMAGLLTAVSVSLVFWGQSARSYAILVAFSCASFAAFVALVEPREGAPDGRAHWGPWIAYVLVTALALYMSLMAALVVVAQLATFAWWWRRRRYAVVSAVTAIGVLSIPLALLAAGRGSGQVAWVSRPKLADIEQVLEALTGAGLQPSIHATATTFVLLWLTVAALIAIAVAIVRGGRGATRQKRFGPALLASWLVVPVALTFIEALVAQPLFLPRNLLYGAPAVALLLGWGLTRPRLAPKLALAAVGVLLVLRALQVVPSYAVSPEDWSGATAYVLAHTQRGDCVLFYPADGRMAFQYYLPSRLAATGQARGLVPRPVSPTAPWHEVRTYIEDYATPSRGAVAQLPSSCTRLWFISTHQGRRNGSPAARAVRRRYIELRDALQAAYARHFERLFGYASAVHVELLSG